jgi:subtilisin family serine protease
MAPRAPSKPLAALALAILLSAATAGCLGGEARSEWAYEVTQLAAANQQGHTGAGVKVGILDTGINVAHPALDHLVDGDDSNGELKGFRDFIRGRNGVQNAYDDQGHGSHVAGIMVAMGSTLQDRLLYGGINLQGGSPAILLYVAKVCDDTCSITAVDQALDWMRQEGVDIISLSLGGKRTGIALGDSTVTRVNAAIDTGIVVIASAGNSGPCADETHTDVEAPADIRGVIAVGAIDEAGRVACFSSQGNNSGANACRQVPLAPPIGRCDPNKKPELAAPGVDILSTWSQDRYVRASGTSQAAPFVTSVVALMLEGKPPLQSRADVEQVKRVLVQTAAPLAGQKTPHDDAAGYGLVQAVAAIEAYG